MNSKIIALLTLIAFVAIGVLGLSHSLGMGTEGCLLHPTISICGMTIFEHIETWRNMLAALPLITILSFVSLVSLLAIGVSFNHAPTLIRQRYRWRSDPPLFYDPLQEALAQGILNPKIYW